MESQKECRKTGFFANIIENHDEPRGRVLIFPTMHRTTMAQKCWRLRAFYCAASLLYQGQEIGMKNCKMESIDEYNDIDTKNQYKIALEAGLDEEAAMNVCLKHSRDNARTPMQWSAGENAGFTTGKPWLKINPDYKERNVEAEEKDQSSVLSYYKELLALRKSEDYGEVFTYGDFVPAYEGEEMLLAYYRQDERKKVLVAANFGKGETSFLLEKEGKEILKNRKDVLSREKELILPGCGVAVVEL